jgi:hypothetical protein
MRAAARIILGALFLAAGVAGLSRAQEGGPDHEGVSAYSVARLKIFEGSVWVRTADSGDWEEYFHNSPVAERSRISVPEGSEAELQFHGGQFMLLTPGTEVDIQRMDVGMTVFRLRGGEIRFDLPEHDFAPVRVLVPQDAQVDFRVPGKYWVTAGDDGQSRVVVRAGEGTVVTGSGESAVKAGQEARVGRDVRIGRYAEGAEEYGAPHPLSDEERAAGIPPAAAYELRDYGEWVYSRQYGYVWRPRVAEGWSPYYYGRWVWISPYGWTWVSHEPWGWYPYHYGYWHIDPFFGWVWYPFRSFVSVSFIFGGHHFHHFHGHAHFFPARVRFVRDGRDVRWVPLRPGERFERGTFTRADKRLTRWDRQLGDGTVFVRTDGRKDTEWRDWTAAPTQRSGVRGTRVEVRREGVGERARGGGAGPGRREPAAVVRPEPRAAPAQVRPERQDRERGGEAVQGRPEGSGGRNVVPGRDRVREQPARTPDRRMQRNTDPGSGSGSVGSAPGGAVRPGDVRRERYDVPARGGPSVWSPAPASPREMRPERGAEALNRPAARPRSVGPGGRDAAPPVPRVRSGNPPAPRLRSGDAEAPRVRAGGSAVPRGRSGSVDMPRVRSGGSAGPEMRGNAGSPRVRSWDSTFRGRSLGGGRDGSRFGGGGMRR